MPVKWWLGTTSGNFGTAANWSDAAAPVNGDTLVFDYRGNAGTGPTLGLATVLTGLTIYVEKSFTDPIGVLTDAAATYLVIDGGTVHIGSQGGQGSATGSSLVMINTGSTAATFNIYDSASTSSSTYYPPIIIKGTAMTVNHQGGSVGIAPLHALAAGTAEVATLTSCKVSKGNGSIDPTLYLGQGVTTTALYQSAGTVYNRSDQTQTLVEKTAGTYRYSGSAAHTALTNLGGTVYSEGAGTITKLVNGGTFDTTRDARAKIVQVCEAYDGAVFDLRTGALDGTALRTMFPTGIKMIRTGLGEEIVIRTDPHVTLNFGGVVI
jgi:hypothetical protein